VPVNSTVLLVDELVYQLYASLFSPYRVIIIASGEASKNWKNIALLADKLIDLDVHKTSLLVGVGGGVVCDITGFLSSIYMRGTPFGFVPTTLLAMVDAAIGGKNGVNLGLHKNMLGTITQPKFLLFDTIFLASLSDKEWSNGFAEIIKYACISDVEMWQQLISSDLLFFKANEQELNKLIAKCVQHKNRIVLADEQEKNLRKTLNFGHTAGHAFETIYCLQHGEAVALGMIVALIASEQKFGLDKDIRLQLVQTLQQYQLPTRLSFNPQKTLDILKYDKKRNNQTIDFVLLKSIGQAVIVPLPFDTILETLQLFASECES
jgi:3-dehydroquinate synthase